MPTAANIRTPAGVQDYMFQMEPSRLRKWQVARGNVLSGVSNAKLACIGDSTTAGTGANATLNLARQTSYPAQLAAVLTSNGVTAGRQNFFGSANLTLSSFDSRFTTTGSQGAVNTTLGGALQQMTGANTITWTPSTSCDTWDVYSVKTGGTGAFTINVDGGSTLATVSGTSSPTIMVKTTVSGSGAALNMVRSSGTCYVTGVSSYLAATKQVEVWNMGASGAKAANLAATTQPYSELNALAFYAPNLTILMLGINDWEASTDLSSWVANMQSVITTALISGDVVLMTPVPTGQVATLAMQKRYVDAFYELAFYNRIPLVDNWTRWGEYTALNTAGFFYDTLHPAGPGYSDIALNMSRALAFI